MAQKPIAKWPARLAKPVDPMECIVRYRAQSILTEAGAPGPLLPYSQALDVVRWHESQPTRRRQSRIARWIRMIVP